jgi:hypothetical protein
MFVLTAYLLIRCTILYVLCVGITAGKASFCVNLLLFGFDKLHIADSS